MSGSSANTNIEVRLDTDRQYIQVRGELTVHTVMNALDQFSKACRELPRWVIDFTHVSRVDSTAVALR